MLKFVEHGLTPSPNVAARLERTLAELEGAQEG
jgi:hypothetical protein